MRPQLLLVFQQHKAFSIAVGAKPTQTVDMNVRKIARELTDDELARYRGRKRRRNCSSVGRSAAA